METIGLSYFQSIHIYFKAYGILLLSYRMLYVNDSTKFVTFAKTVRKTAAAAAAAATKLAN